jgi:general secretion pathway protein D
VTKMSRKRYSIVLAVVLLAGILPARVVYAAMTAEEIELRKKQVIVESLQKLGDPTAPIALVEAAAQAEALLEITLDRSARETRVCIHTTDEPAYESFSLEDRNRVVVDIYNTINFHSGETYKLEEPTVLKSVRTSLFELEPAFKSRVVLDLEKMVGIRVAQRGNTIDVIIPEDVEIPAAPPAVPEKPAELAQVRQPVTEPAQPVARTAEPAKGEEVGDAAELRKQLDLQKESYAKLRASSDEAERKLKADLEASAREARRAVEAQKTAVAELKEQLAAEAAEKEKLSTQLAKTQEQATTRGRKQVGGGAAPVFTEQRVTMNFKEVPLVSVLELLKRQANVNLLAGGEVKGTVTAMLDDVPVMKALELVLRENGYGMVYEDGIYRVVPVKLAEEMGVATATETFKLDYALASDMATVLTDIVTTKGKVVANDNANVVIVTDDPGNMSRIADVVEEVDVPPVAVHTMSGTFRLSYLEATTTSAVLEKMVTENGRVIPDISTNSIILTDTPANFQVVSDLITTLDQKPDQVYIEVLMVDAVLSDDGELGTQWLARALRDNHGGNLDQLDFETVLGNVGTQALDAGMMTLGILGGDFQLDGVIAAEVRSNNATILADPKVLVLNNETAMIEIVTEYPFQEITQSTQGPPVSSTEFKDIGTTLEVTPRITHENTLILQVRPQESSIRGFTNDGIPIEDSRRTETSVLLDDGQTVVVGGLRSIARTDTVTKVPWLGDIPLLGAVFRNTVTSQSNTELLVFLTVHIVKGVPPELTPYEQEKFNEIDIVEAPDATRTFGRSLKRPWSPPRQPWWKPLAPKKVEQN